MEETKQTQGEWHLPKRISWGQLCIVTPVGCLLLLIAFVIALEGLKAGIGGLFTALLLVSVGLYYLFPLCWELGAKERIVLTQSQLIFYRCVGMLRWRQEICRDDIASMEVAYRKHPSYVTHYMKNWFSPNPLFGFQGGVIQVVTARSIYAIGISLKESEAPLLLREIQSALLQSPVSQESETVK